MANVKINDLSAASSVTDSMQFEVDTGGSTSEKATAVQVKTYCQDGVSLDTHNHDSDYAALSHTHAAFDINSGTMADARIAESNVTQHEAAIDHDSLTNFVGNEHIDHSAVSVSAGTGLTGGGTIAATRTINMDTSGLTDETDPASNDTFPFYDTTASAMRRTDGSNLSKVHNHDADYAAIGHNHDSDYAAISHNHAASDITSGTLNDARIAESNVTQHEAALDHDALTNFVANEHINHTSVTLTAGTGLSGGGTIAANRTFNLATDGLTDETDPTTTDTFPFYDSTASAMRRTNGSNLSKTHNHDSDYCPLLLEETTTRTTNYTLALSDAAMVVPMNGSSIALTVPPNSTVAFDVGTVVNVYNLHSTALTITEGSGVTIRNNGTVAQYGEISLRKRATDEWVLAGNVS